ncbi:hypothetical protein D3C80_1147820 [compost metagenome]
MGFTMYDKGVPRGLLEAAQPLHDLVSIGMRRQALHGKHLGTYWNILTVHTDCPCAGNDVRTARTTGLKTGEEQAIAWIGGQCLEVMQHPATGCHAAGGDDHCGIAKLVKVSGFVDSANDVCALAHRCTRLSRQTMLTVKTLIQRRSIRGHWTV